MMLKAFRGISLFVITINGTNHTEVTPLTPAQEKILLLLGLSKSTYIALKDEPIELMGNLSER